MAVGYIPTNDFQLNSKRQQNARSKGSGFISDSPRNRFHVRLPSPSQRDFSEPKCNFRVNSKVIIEYTSKWTSGNSSSPPKFSWPVRHHITSQGMNFSSAMFHSMPVNYYRRAKLWLLLRTSEQFGWQLYPVSVIRTACFDQHSPWKICLRKPWKMQLCFHFGSLHS